MFTLSIVDQRDRGPGHGSEPGNFTWMVHPQFDNARLVPCPQAQQRQGHANIVVEIAFGGKSALRLPGPQNRRDHLGDRGFPVASGNGNQRQAELCAPGGSQLAQRDFGVSDFKTGQTGLVQTVLRNGSYRALGLGLRQKFMGIEILTLERHEQIARLQAARVGVYAHGHDMAIADQPDRWQPVLDLLQAHHAVTSWEAAADRASKTACA